MQSSTKLTSLDVSFCSGVFQTDKHLKYLTSITRLNIAGCPVTEPIVTKIIETAGTTINLHSLTSMPTLHIQCIHTHAHAYMHIICTACTHLYAFNSFVLTVELRDLDLSYNDGIRETFAAHLAGTSVGAGTGTGALSSSTGVSAGGILGRQLRTLNLAFCKFITLKTAQQVQQARPDLIVYFFNA